MTWKEIKVATLQKMESAEGNSIPSDDSVTDYVAAMPQAANEALLLLSTANKFIIKSMSIAHNPIDNLLGDCSDIRRSNGGAIEISAKGAHSFYAEMFGLGTVTVTVGDSIMVYGCESKKSYKPFKDIIENPNNENVTIKFESQYPFAVKNTALYEASFETADDIVPYTEVIKYQMREIVDDFYMLESEQIYFEGDDTTGRYIKADQYFQEGNSVLVLPRDMPGNYTVYYKAYPEEITSATPDDYVLPLDKEVVALLPLYMASQIYKGDEIGIATTYRNEFEVARDALQNKPNMQAAEEFRNESGWY